MSNETLFDRLSACTTEHLINLLPTFVEYDGEKLQLSITVEDDEAGGKVFAICYGCIGVCLHRIYQRGVDLKYIIRVMLIHLFYSHLVSQDWKDQLIAQSTELQS